MKKSFPFNMTLKILVLGTLTNLSTAMNAQAFEPFISEIKQFPYTFCPRGWAEANGQLLNIASNTALFSLVGTIYGGDGRTTFGLPNLNGRVAKGQGTGPGLSTVRQGEKGGSNTVVLTTNQLPNHSHSATTISSLNVTDADGNTSSPENAILADDGRDRVYNREEPGVSLAPNAVTSSSTLKSAGSASPTAIDRRQPSIGMRFCIATTGIYPSRS